jgi:hypothetical protein
VKNLPDVKENYEHALDFAIHSVNLDFPYTVHVFFPECLSNHYQGLYCTFLFLEIFTKCNAALLYD